MDNKIINKLIIFSTVLISILASVYYLTLNESLLYRDAKSHLNIARRVFFSQTPGFTQLGGVWLPLPHVLMIPTIWIDWFYYTGLAGIIPSMIAFIAMTVVMYAIVYKFTQSKIAGILSCLVMVTNPSLLYLQSTPMTEILLMSATIISAYFLLEWTISKNYLYLIFGSFFICLATLVRYDAWFFFIWEIGTVFLVSHFSKERKETESNVLLFCVLGGFGIFLWLLYNKMIFGNMLNFALGQGSGSWDTKRVLSQSSFSTRHNLVRSTFIYAWMTIDNVGLIALIGGTVGLLIYCFSYFRKRIFLIGMLFLSPFVFNVVSLYLGQSVALSRHLFPYQTYNLRYGSAMIPSIAFFLGIFARNRYGKFIVSFLIVIQCSLFYTHPLEILADAQVGNFQAEDKVSQWIYHHPAKGLTLISTLSHDPVVFNGHIPMQQLVYEGNQQLWTHSLLQPERYVDRIVIQVSDTTNDLVRKKLYGKGTLNKYFKLDYNVEGFQVYDKKM